MSTGDSALQQEGGGNLSIQLPEHHPLQPGDLADMSPLRHSLSRSERKQSSINVLGFDLYDAVEVEQKGWRGAKEWVPGTIVQVNAHNNTFDVKVLKPNQEGEVLENVSPVRMRRIAESRHPHQQKGDDSPQLGPVPGDSPTHDGQDFLKQRHLGAADACEIMDEFNFQMQASLFTSKVLKQLDSVPESDLMAVSPCVKSLAHIRERTRSRVESGEGPLLDRFFFQCDTDAAAGQASGFPTSAQVMKMLESITDFHANCPFTNSGGVADVAMGTNCIVADRNCEEICSPEAVVRLLDKMYELLEMEAPTALISVTVPADGRLVVVGDTHGQLEDVLWMLFKHGVPNKNNVYLFNGDIADRGGHALEIFILLFLFKLLCPQSVYILRGNHEDDYCNLNYGFLAELRHKFGQVEGGRMHRDFLRVFYSLPLSCVIDSWGGYYRCQQTHMLVQLKVGSSPVAVSDMPGQHRRVVPVLLRECSGEEDMSGSSSGDDDDEELSTENGWYQGGVSEERLVFDKRVGVRGLNENGETEIKWSSGDIWTYVSPRLIVLHGGLPMHPGSGSPISSQRPTGAFASLFSGSSAMGPQTSTSQDDEGRKCVLLKYFHQLPNRMRIPSSPQGVFEQWMYQILWSDPREVGDTKGRGTPFYPDDTELFCARNNIHTVIRSHQLPAMQRGFSFHHKHKLITIFSASNYCGTSQNYGGLLIFTTELFPEIQYSRNLFEHWSPPLSVIQDVYSKHKNASQDVRQYIARETESARMPTDMNSSSKWLYIEQKVSEYAMSLIVQNKRHLWTNLWTRDEDKTMRVDLADWEDACAQVVGHQFPWRTLFVQLDIEEEDDGTVDYLDFLNRFRASLRDESGPFDSWLASVVLGFFMDILNADMAIQQDLLTGEPGENLINYEQFERSLRDNCPDLTITHIQLVWQALIECSTPERRRAGLVDARQFVCACGEFYRARWDLHEPVFSNSQTLPSANEEEMLEKIMDFLPRLRDSIEQQYDNDTQRFFEEKIEGPAKKKIPGAVSNEDFVNALTAELPSLGITELPSRNFLELTARMMESCSATSNGHPASGRGARLVSSTNSGYVSLFRFMATLHVDGTEAGRVMAQKIMEHSCAATYFHRNAFKCACARLDPQNCGEISKRNFRKAFTALNQALDPEWRLTKLQIDAALDHFDWTVDADEEFTDASSSDQDMKSVDEEPPPATVAGQARRPTLGALSASNTNSALEMLRERSRTRSSARLMLPPGVSTSAPMVLDQPQPEQLDQKMWINYDQFLRSFEIADWRKNSRAGSFGWHLLRNSMLRF